MVELEGKLGIESSKGGAGEKSMEEKEREDIQWEGED